MFPISRLSRRTTLAFALGATTITAASAATMHRLAITQTTGSEGAGAELQTSATGSAIQGEVAPSVNTGIKLPFGVLGEYNAAGSTFGIGVIGLSTTGYGVGGESLSNSQPSILADPGGNGMGLEALTQSTSSSPAIFAESKGPGGYGIEAEVINGNAIAGVFGQDISNPTQSHDTDGVYGSTQNGAYGVEGDSGYGAMGGVYGSAATGVGVSAYSDSGDGMDAYSGGGNGVAGFNTASGSGVAGVNQVSSGNLPSLQTQNLGVFASSTIGAGLYATSADNYGAIISNASNSREALDITKTSGAGPLLEAQTSYGYVSIDGYGDIDASGSINTTQGVTTQTRNPASDEMSYGAQETEPTMEDVGSGRLVNGSATVPLAADYRQTIADSPYLVFLTPQGDCNGLYVEAKTPGGFIVRELHGGRSTLAFDYRIVAQQYGARDGRLPHYATLHPNARIGRRAEMGGAISPSALEEAAAERMRMLASTQALAAKNRAAMLRAHDRQRFVPPPVFMPDPASLSTR
jgi:hypothetical protein